MTERSFPPDGLPPEAPRQRAAPRPLPDPAPLEPADLPLYEALRSWRRRLAASRAIPPYLILHNRTLAELARWRPATLDQLRQVRGIGEAKASAYGAALLAVVQDPCAGLAAEDGLAQVTALLVAGDYEVAADPSGALVARPRAGGTVLRVVPVPLEPLAEAASGSMDGIPEGAADA